MKPYPNLWSDEIGYRIAVYGAGDEPLDLPSVGRARDAVMPLCVAAVKAAPNALSDDRGMYWTSRIDAERALVAVRQALKWVTL